MRRRLGIAQAMLGNPAFIMVDEPTAGLDPEERIRFRGFIRRVAANRVVLLSTHIIEDIKNNCDGLALINNGKVKQFDGFEELENMAKGKVWKMVINSNDFYKIEASTRYFQQTPMRIIIWKFGFIPKKNRRKMRRRFNQRWRKVI